MKQIFNFYPFDGLRTIFNFKRGFTLIELLVVIGVLGVVGSVATGVVTFSLRGANKTQNIESIRQSGNYAISQMSKTIEYAQSFEGLSNGEVNSNGEVIFFMSCPFIPPTPTPTPQCGISGNPCCAGSVCNHASLTCTQDTGTCRQVKRVFVSNGSWRGNLGGFHGANSKCHGEAFAVWGASGQSGVWSAYLDANPVPIQGHTYYRPDGFKIGSPGLTIPYPINVNASGGPIPAGEYAWTRDGCRDRGMNWTSNDEDDDGGVGDPSTNGTSWRSNGDQRCSKSNRLYCFEQ